MSWLRELGPQGSLWWIGGGLCGIALTALIIAIDLTWGHR